MSWSEFLTRLLESTNKVDKAAIFNHKGQPLATTEDLQISESDGRALLNCLRDPARSLTRISLDGTDFRCFQGNDRALVGRATNDVRRVLVARLTDDALVLVMGTSTGHGSFLYELQHHLQQRARRQMGAIDDLAAGDDGAESVEQKQKGLSLSGPSGLNPSMAHKERGDSEPLTLQ